MQSIALVEIAGSHDECLYSQITALKSRGYRVVLVCTPEMKERNPHFQEGVDEFLVHSFERSQWVNFWLVRKILKQLKSRNVRKVIFNTAQGGHVRNACMLHRFGRMEFIGIIHTTRKFEGSFTQKLINTKIKRYFLLSQFLLEKVQAPKGIQLEYFYPLRYPNFDPVQRTHDRLQLTVIGGVENRRKDLDGLMELLEQSRDLDWHLTFLGKSDNQKEEVVKFKQILRENSLFERATFYDHFVSHQEFDAVLQHTDAILPLVHPNTDSADQYFRNQISGATNVALGYGIPLMIHEEYQRISELNDASIYYNFENFSECLEQLPDQLASIRERIKSNSLYDCEYQEKRYADFVEKTSRA